MKTFLKPTKLKVCTTVVFAVLALSFGTRISQIKYPAGADYGIMDCGETALEFKPGFWFTPFVLIPWEFAPFDPYLFNGICLDEVIFLKRTGLRYLSNFNAWPLSILLFVVTTSLLYWYFLVCTIMFFVTRTAGKKLSN